MFKSLKMSNEYKYNKKFREHTDKYCDEHQCTLNDALQSEEIQSAFLKYTEV